MPTPPPSLPSRTPLESLGALALAQGGAPLRALGAGDAERLIARAFPAPPAEDDGHALRLAFARGAGSDPVASLRTAFALGGGGAVADGLMRFAGSPVGLRFAERVHGAAAQLAAAAPRPAGAVRPAGAPAAALDAAGLFLALPADRQHAVYAALLARHRGLPVPFGAWRGEELVAGMGRWPAAAVADLGRLAAAPAAAAGLRPAKADPAPPATARALPPLPPMPARPSKIRF